LRDRYGHKMRRHAKPLFVMFSIPIGFVFFMAAYEAFVLQPKRDARLGRQADAAAKRREASHARGAARSAGGFDGADGLRPRRDSRVAPHTPSRRGGGPGDQSSEGEEEEIRHPGRDMVEDEGIWIEERGSSRNLRRAAGME